MTTNYEVDGGRIRVEKWRSGFCWHWIDERGRRISEYFPGHLNTRSCLEDAEKQTALRAMGHQDPAAAMRSMVEPEQPNPWWVRS